MQQLDHPRRLRSLADMVVHHRSEAEKVRIHLPLNLSPLWCLDDSRFHLHLNFLRLDLGLRLLWRWRRRRDVADCVTEWAEQIASLSPAALSNEDAKLGHLRDGREDGMRLGCGEILEEGECGQGVRRRRRGRCGKVLVCDGEKKGVVLVQRKSDRITVMVKNGVETSADAGRLTKERHGDS